MRDNFTTAATAAVFDALANEPGLFELAAQHVRETPAKAPEEVRSFVEKYVRASLIHKEPITMELLDAALREVRWRELCNRVRDMDTEN